LVWPLLCLYHNNLKYWGAFVEILIVDDSLEVLRVIAKNIKRWGHCVETSESGQAALEKVRQKKFDLVFLEIFLPDCKGHELIPQFKKMCPDMHIVAMTGYNSRDLEWAVRQHGITYFMTKPFRVKTMKDILDHIETKREKEVITALGDIEACGGTGTVIH